MTSLACVCAAGLIHLIHNWAMPNQSPKTPGPQLPSLFVTVAMMDLIYDNCFFPRRFEAMPLVFKRIYELAVSFLLLKFGMIVFWAPVERQIYLLTKIILLATGLVSEGGFERHEDFWVGCVTVPLSLLILAFDGQAFWAQTKVELQEDPALRFLNRYRRANGRPLPNMRRRGQFYVEHFDVDDDSE